VDSYLIGNSCKPAGTVLDPFAGSGTAIIAAEKTGRVAHALEIDPAYADVIVERWQSYTGKPALCGVTGVTFEELAEQRASGVETCAVEPADDGARP